MGDETSAAGCWTIACQYPNSCMMMLVRSRETPVDASDAAAVSTRPCQYHDGTMTSAGDGRGTQCEQRERAYIWRLVDALMSRLMPCHCLPCLARRHHFSLAAVSRMEVRDREEDEGDEPYLSIAPLRLSLCTYTPFCYAAAISMTSLRSHCLVRPTPARCCGMDGWMGVHPLPLTTSNTT